MVNIITTVGDHTLMTSFIKYSHGGAFFEKGYVSFSLNDYINKGLERG